MSGPPSSQLDPSEQPGNITQNWNTIVLNRKFKLTLLLKVLKAQKTHFFLFKFISVHYYWSIHTLLFVKHLLTTQDHQSEIDLRL